MTEDETATFHGCFQANLIFSKKCLKRLYNNFSALSVIMISILSLLEYIEHFFLSLPVSLEDKKLIAIVNLIFHLLEFLEVIYDMFQVWSKFIKIFFN